MNVCNQYWSHKSIFYYCNVCLYYAINFALIRSYSIHSHGTWHDLKLYHIPGYFIIARFYLKIFPKKLVQIHVIHICYFKCVVNIINIKIENKWTLFLLSLQEVNDRCIYIAHVYGTDWGVPYVSFMCTGIILRNPYLLHNLL